MALGTENVASLAWKSIGIGAESSGHDRRKLTLFLAPLPRPGHGQSKVQFKRCQRVFMAFNVRINETRLNKLFLPDLARFFPMRGARDTIERQGISFYGNYNQKKNQNEKKSLDFSPGLCFY